MIYESVKVIKNASINNIRALNDFSKSLKLTESINCSSLVINSYIHNIFQAFWTNIQFHINDNIVKLKGPYLHHLNIV